MTKGSLQKTHWRSSTPSRKIGDLITADHKVPKEEGASLNNYRYAVVGTKILPLSGYNLTRVRWKLHRRRKGVYENFSSRRKSRKSFTLTSLWNHRTSTPHRSETNGIAERVVRRIKEGTSAVLLQSGLVGGFHRMLLLSAKHARSLLDSGKDDSGAYVVFTEQGSSASQITAAKVMDAIARLPGCAGQADHKVLSEGYESRTVIDALSWYKIWHLNGFNLIRVNQNFPGDPEEASWSSWSGPRNQKSFTLTIPWHLANPVKKLSWNHLYVNTAQIGNRWDYWESSAQSERRNIFGTVAIRSGWKMVGGFHGVLLLSAKHSRSLVWWEDSIWKAFRNALWRTSDAVWSNGRISPYLCERPVKASSNLVRKFYLEYFSDMHWSRENLERRFYGCRHWGVGKFQRLNAKEVLTPQRSEKIKFPVADGTAKLFGRKHEFREPTLREQPVSSEDLRGELQGEPEGFQPTDSRDDAEAWRDFWSIQGDFIHRHHIEPRLQLFVPKEETFPIPLKYIDATRATYTNLDVLQEKRPWWPLDRRRESKFRDFFFLFFRICWKGFTKFIPWKENPPKGHMWSGERPTKIQATVRPDNLWPENWFAWEKQLRRKARMGERKTKARQRSKTERHLFHRSGRWRIQRKASKTQE